jgi:enoyl-CoA hydratase
VSRDADRVIRLERLETDEGMAVASIVLDRPRSRNAFNNQMARELHASCKAIEAMSDIGVVIVKAEGPVFCAGADVKERATLSDDDIRARRLRGFRAYDAIEALPIPVFCVVDGPCVGSGCEIALACDFIIASDRASFRVPEARLGTVGATQRLSRAIGLRRAKEMMFGGRAIDSGQALCWGLVNRVVPAGELDDEVAALARSIAQAPAAAMKLAKRAMILGFDDSRHGALAHEILAIEDNLDGGDARSGMRSALKN